MAPEAGLEPATIALTGRCSTIELLRNGAFGLLRDNPWFSLIRPSEVNSDSPCGEAALLSFLMKPQEQIDYRWV